MADEHAAAGEMRTASGRPRATVLLGAGLAVVLAVVGFVVVLWVRGGDEEPTPAEGVTADAEASSTESTVATAPADDPPAPIVTEVRVPVVAPLGPADGNGTELPPIDTDAFEGVEFQTDPVDILSPIVGEATIEVVADETGPGGGPVIAPPVLAAELGLLGSGQEPPDGDGDSEPLDAVVGPEPDLAAIERFAAERAAAAAGEEPGGEGSEGGDGTRGGSTPGPAPGFVDLCAELDDPSCPEVGEPGTVTDTFALVTPPRFWVVVTPRPVDHCPAASGSDVSVRIESSTPIATLSLEYWRGGFPSEARTLEITTPDDVAAEWLAAFEAATDEPPPPIVHCGVLTELTRGEEHQYRGAATDVFDQSWETGGTPPKFAGPEWRIPRTLVLPIGDNELVVSAPHRRDQRVLFQAFRRTSDALDGDPCASTERSQPGYELPVTPMELRRSSTDREALAAAGFDRRYDQRTFGTLRLDEGSQYRLCIYTSLVDGPTFDQGIERVEAYDIVTPDALDITFDLVGIHSIPAIPAGTLDVTVRPTGRGYLNPPGGCGAWSNSTRVQGVRAVNEEICTVPPDTIEAYRTGARVELRVEDASGEEFRFEWIVPVYTCVGPCIPPAADRYRLGIGLGEADPPVLCGIYGDPCGRSSNMLSLLIEVRYGNARGNFGADWSIGPPDELGDQRPDPPEWPRLEVFASQLRATGEQPDRSSATLELLADRPVTATLTLVDENGDPGCNRGTAPHTATSTGMRERHTLTIENLCPDEFYEAILELTDADGDSSRWHAPTFDPGFDDGQVWWGGRLRTPGVPLAFEYDVIISSRGLPRMRVHDVGLAVSGREAPLTIRTTEDGTWASVNGCQEQPIRNGANRTTARTGLEIEITFTVEVEMLADRCRRPPDGFEQPGRVVLTRTVALDDVLADPLITTVVLDQEIPLPGLDDPDASVYVRADVRLRGVTAS